MFKITSERVYARKIVNDKWDFETEKDIARFMAREIKQISAQLFKNIRKFGYSSGDMYNSIWAAIQDMRDTANKYSALTSYDN